MSTEAGISSGRGTSCPWACGLADMFVPVLVAVDLAPHGGEEHVLHGPGDRTGLAELAVVDRADGHDLGGGAGQERLVGGVEVASQHVAVDVLDVEVAG